MSIAYQSVIPAGIGRGLSPTLEPAADRCLLKVDKSK
jgi:hypothetical protein